MTLMDRTGALLARMERVFLWVSIIALMLAGLLVLLAVPSRSFPAIAVPDNVLFVQSLLLISIALGLGHATGQGEHISVDLLYNRFGSRTRLVTRYVALVAGLVFFIPLAWWYAKLGWGYFESGRTEYGTLRLPKWPPYVILSLGFCLVSLRLTFFLLSGAPEPAAQTHQTNG
ncbi:MAG: TRAP transporter small permease [Sagittula sp.]|uniref:TRAP transporter small permease n=1 Tax=Sagittula sp. TaxID=2038081 RepID=UPI00405A3F85